MGMGMGGLRLSSRTDDPAQRCSIDRLLQEAVEWPSVPDGLVFCSADQNKQRRCVAPATLTDLRGQRQAIRVGHLQINQYRVEVFACQQWSGLSR